MIQDPAPATDNNSPTRIRTARGGNDFLSGTSAGSRTLMLGTSRASSTLAISYCLVNVSKTVSSTLVRRYKSDHVTPRMGNWRMEGYKSVFSPEPALAADSG